MSHESTILFEAPHTSLKIPEYARNHLLNTNKVIADTDHGVPEFYDGIPNCNWLTGNVARAVLDCNREIPEHPYLPTNDGAIKLQTQFGEPIWKDENGPPQEVRDRLIQELKHYYQQLQNTVERLSRETSKLLIWCAHSYTEKDVQTSTVNNQQPSCAGFDSNIRPVYMISNGGGFRGENPHQNGLEQQAVLDVANMYKRFAEQLPTDALVLNPDYLVGINYPYTGEQSIRRYSAVIESIPYETICKVATVFLTEMRQDLLNDSACLDITRQANQCVAELLRKNLFPQI